MLLPRRRLRPRSYRLGEGQSVLMGACARVDVVAAPGATLYLTVWASDDIICHFGRTEGVDMRCAERSFLPSLSAAPVSGCYVKCFFQQTVVSECCGAGSRSTPARRWYHRWEAWSGSRPWDLCSHAIWTCQAPAGSSAPWMSPLQVRCCCSVGFHPLATADKALEQKLWCIAWCANLLYRVSRLCMSSLHHLVQWCFPVGFVFLWVQPDLSSKAIHVHF